MPALDGVTQESFKEWENKLKLLWELIKKAANQHSAKIRAAANPEKAAGDIMAKSKNDCLQTLTKAKDMGYLSEDQFDKCRSDVLSMSRFDSADECAVRAASLDALTNDVKGRIRDVQRGAAPLTEFNDLPEKTSDIADTLTNARIPDGWLDRINVKGKMKEMKQAAVRKSKGKSTKTEKMIKDAEAKAKAQAQAKRATGKAERSSGAR